MIHENFHLKITYFMHLSVVILASYNRRVVKFLSHVDSWHICAKAVQSLSLLNIIFDSGPMVIYVFKKT